MVMILITGDHVAVGEEIARLAAAEKYCLLVRVIISVGLGARAAGM
ncbi:MAG TPA: hypothetical protein VIY52_34765 [Streptosporangiaceae bacterium]